MKNAMLLQVFVTLDKQELREFAKFIASPYFNQKPEAILLFEYLKKSKQPTKEEVYEKIYPNEVFTDTKIRLLMSHLLTLIEQFWLYEMQRNQNLTNTYLLAQQYRLRNLEKHFLKSIEESTQYLNTQPLRNANYHWQMYHLLLEENDFQMQNRPLEPPLLDAINTQIHCNSVAMLLKYTCDMLSYEIFINGKPQNTADIDSIAKQIEAHQLQEVPVIKVYYAALLCLSSGEKADFLGFKEILFASTSFFNPNENTLLLRIAMNFCIRKSNEGDEEYRLLLFELYKEALPSKILYQTKYFPHTTYKNIVSIAVIVQQLEWVTTFLEEYKNQVTPKYREDIYLLCKATIAFELEKDYSASLNALNAVKDSNTNDDFIFLISISRRQLTIKNLIELGEFEPAEAQIRAYQSFLTNHSKYQSYSRERYFDWLKIMKVLCQLSQDKSAKNIAKMEKILTEKQIILDKKWILSVFERIKKASL